MANVVKIDNTGWVIGNIELVTLTIFASASISRGRLKARVKCGKCFGCRQDDCDECEACLNKPRNGSRRAAIDNFVSRSQAILSFPALCLACSYTLSWIYLTSKQAISSRLSFVVYLLQLQK